MENTPRLCLACGKALKGRMDKKFCDDFCRNNFNNEQNSDQNNLVRHINRILRKNRRILEEQLGNGEETKKLPRQKLVQLGFNFNYHTHLYTNPKGQVYYFNYEYGYLALEGEWLLIVKRKEE